MKKKTLLVLLSWLLFYFLYGQEQGHWSPEQIAKIKGITAVQVSPDGSKVAYAVRSALMADDRSEYINQIFVSNADASNTIQLTQGDKNNTSPKWSPDGKRLAFISNRDGRNNLYILPAAGGNAERLTSVKTGIGIFDWSPNGQMIAYTMVDSPSETDEKARKRRDDAYFMDENYRQARLYVTSLEKDSAGSRRTRLLTKENRSVSSFSWSPNNQWIVYAHAPSSSANDFKENKISKVNVEAGEVRSLLETNALTINPFFSPDGKWIAYETSDYPIVIGG